LTTLPRQGDLLRPERDGRLSKARKARLRLKKRLVPGKLGEVGSVAGVDAIYEGERVYAAAVVLSVPDLLPLAHAEAVTRSAFPYIRGFFAFREAPALLKAVRALPFQPDLLMIHGHGYAHPDRFGLASHTGVLLDIPTIGVAEHLMTGSVDRLPLFPGEAVPVLDAGEVIGLAVCTRRGAHPLYISAGHKTSLEDAARAVAATTRTHRLPEPLHLADRQSRYFKSVS
jgi:deoxyribonuclease V